MNILKPHIKTIETGLTNHCKFLVIPNTPYEMLKQDFEIATHLKAIDNLNFRNINGIYIRASNATDAILASVYCYKKYVAENYEQLIDQELDITDDFEDVDFDLPDELYEILDDLSFKLLPFVNANDLITTYYNDDSGFFSQQNFAFQSNLPYQSKSPLWKQLSNPLIISYV